MRFGKRNTGHMIDFIFPLILFAVFAISALLVLLLATNIYRETTEASGLDFTARTSLAYIGEKIHQGDREGAVRIEEYNGGQALVLTSELNGTAYDTYIYEYDGQIRELFTEDITAVTPSAGREILEVQSFAMEEIADGVFRFFCTDTAGRTASTVVTVRSDGQ